MISVVIPLFNKENAIARCLSSVLMQTYIDFECVIVDDGSTDGSAEIVKSFSDSRVKYFYRENGGVSSARNIGVKCAKGDWIVFLDADDYFLENALDVLNESVSSHNVNCAVANFYIGKIAKRQLYTQLKSGYIKNPFRLWYLNMFCPRTGTSIFKKSVLEANPFKEELSRYEDAESLFNIMRENVFYFDRRPVMVYTDDFNGLFRPCSDEKKDFLFHRDFSNKKGWEKMCLLHYLNQAYSNYPQKRDELLQIYGEFTGLRVIEKGLFRLLSLYRRMVKFVFCCRNNYDG
jgi:glycosyltransferase involved in cell wall biosynthesis